MTKKEKKLKLQYYLLKWHIDALWADDEGHPYGWKSAAVDLSGNGVHSFFGLEYDSYKI